VNPGVFWPFEVLVPSQSTLALRRVFLLVPLHPIFSILKWIGGNSIIEDDVIVANHDTMQRIYN